MFRRSAVVARQREMKHVSLDMLDFRTVLRGYYCMATNNRAAGAFYGARPGVIEERHNPNRVVR
jgi:hypothetical protein